MVSASLPRLLIALVLGEAPICLVSAFHAFSETLDEKDVALDDCQHCATGLYQLAAIRSSREMDVLNQTQDWSYEAPEDWAASYPDCGGSEQSPVNLPSTALHGDASLAALLNYSGVSGLKAVNNGNAIQVDGGFGTLALPDGQYQAVQFHFHFPSEHSVDGELAAGELHIVHQRIGTAHKHLAVIGVLLSIAPPPLGLESSANALLNRLGFAAGLPPPGGETEVAETVDLKEDLDQELSGPYYHYQGSLTTPPCSQSVHWYVLARPALVTQAMVDTFKDRFPDPMNNRPLQPMNGRALVSSSLEVDGGEFGLSPELGAA